MDKACPWTGNDHVTSEHEIEAPSGARTVDGSNGGCGVLTEKMNGSSPEVGVGHAGLGIEICDLCQVGAGQKNFRVGRPQHHRVLRVLRR
jgi:hypothetical protein